MAIQQRHRGRTYFALGSAAVVVVTGVFVLVGWATDSEALKGVLPGLATMKPNTALALILAGFSLWALAAAGAGHRLLGRGAAIGVAGIGLVNVLQYVFAIDFGVVQLLFLEGTGATHTLAPGRMAPATAAMLLSVGVGLILVQANRALLLAQAATLLAQLVATLCCLSYLYATNALDLLPVFSSVAVHTAAAVLLLSMGVLAASPDRGVVGLVSGSSVSAALLRRLLPTAVLAPILLGWLRLQGQRAGWYGTEFGIALFALSIVIVFAGFLCWSAARMQQTEDGRLRAAELLRSGEQRMRLLLEGVPQLVWTCRADGGCDYLSRQWVEYTGRREAEQLGGGWLDAVHPDDRASLSEHWRRAVESQTPLDVESRIRGAAGGYRWFKTRAVWFAEEGGGKWLGTSTDIHDQKLAEEQLRELNATLEERVAERTAALLQSKERLKLALANSRQGLWDWDIPSGRVYFDNAWEQLLAYEPGEVPHRLEVWQESVHPDDMAAVLDRLQAHLASDAVPYEVEYRGRTKSGEWIWVNARGRVQERDADGRPLRMSGTIQDVTARKRAEAALRANEVLLRQFVTHAPAAIAMLDTEMRYLQISDRWRIDYHLDGQDIIGRSHYEVFPDIPERWKEIHRRVLGGAVEACAEDPFPRADGGVEWLQWEARPWRDADGEIGGLIFFTQVITPRKRAEEALRASEQRHREVVEDQTEAVSRLRADGTYIFVNEVFCRTFGGTPAERLGTRWNPVVYPDDIPLIEAALATMTVANPIVPIENRVFDAAGRVRWMEFVNRGFFGPGGELVEIQSVGRDVTDRHDAEVRLRASLREKDVLLKEIHHRVKNNLQIVSALLDLQSRHTKDGPARTMFQESRGRVRSMALIHERLYRAQDMARVDFAEYLRLLTRDLLQTYRVSGDLRLELDVSVPSLTIDIAIPCGLLVNELISNCLKHAFAGADAGCIRVSFHRGEGETNVLTVADDGAGFPAGTDIRNATSFGLQLVVTLVDQLSGEIELRTGQGTMITVRFPNAK